MVAWTISPFLPNCLYNAISPKLLTVLSAVGEGLGTCWLGTLDEGKVKDTLRILPLRKRRPLEGIVRLEEFGKLLSLKEAD
jgi:nitroreductase